MTENFDRYAAEAERLGVHRKEAKLATILKEVSAGSMTVESPRSVESDEGAVQ